MKLTSIITIGVLISWVSLVILNMWFDIMSAAVFVKLTITLGLVTVIALVIVIAKRE